jgi:predicted Rossmann-fold nucleotide-binding protein
MIEIESLEQFDRAATRAGSETGPTTTPSPTRTRGSMRGWQVQGLDLTGRDDVLLALDPRGALFLGCTLTESTADRLRAGGALLFPAVPDVPFDPWRAQLYTAAELYDGIETGYEDTTDARVYAWSLRTRKSGSLKDLLARSLHDSSIDDALEELTSRRRIVGVMGGHALGRDDPAYAEAALLAHDLAGTGLTVATGGGPGAMEAANLGARLADQPATVLDKVLQEIAAVPGFRDDITAWARVAIECVRDLDDSGRSLGIPTWHYGHEPPNPFSSAVAKYFRNAIREDVLLEVCTSGIVFLPGVAGTVQEVFQAACTNYYATPEQVAPMVFVGQEYWTETLPAWPLVSALAGDRALAGEIHLVDDTSQVSAFFSGSSPDERRSDHGSSRR